MRGQLRIYLGAAPGVGKTFAMLDEGHRRAERGTDVVVGLVETHGRALTAAQLAGLEVVPRRSVPYRGQTFEEMDLPAILRRRPAVVLVDELAHTNIPGVEHEKRWEDVEDLLAAGIDVISTVNLQHLESVNDVVAAITGTVQRETVPDSFVRHAQQVQLVDITPEALRRRMAHGNIYPAERVDAALSNFFRQGNLAALRELALLWLADRVDDELQAYRERHQISHAWETRERLVVSITGGEAAQQLIRRAARMATRARAELVGVHVRHDDGLRRPSDETLNHSVELLEELDGRYIEVVDSDVAAALVSVARVENATQLVIGADPKSRVATFLRGSIVARCVALARGDLDVHVISRDSSEPAPPRSIRRFPLRSVSPSRFWGSLLLTAVALPVLTLALLHSGLASLALALSSFLLVVITVAAIGGLVPGLVGALTSFLVTNWEFAPPVHTFTIANPRDFLALVSYLGAAAVVAGFVDVAARRSSAAARAERDALGLARIARHVVSTDHALVDMLVDIVDLFDLRGAQLRRRGEEEPWVHAGEVGETPTVLSLGDDYELRVDGPSLAGSRRDLLVAISAQIVAALDRRRLEDEAAQRRTLADAERLRAGLLAAVSHDLRTPLASIKTAATTLLDAGDRIPVEDAHSLLGDIDAQADHLNRLVGDLLDVARVNEGTIELDQHRVDVNEVVTRALDTLRRERPGATDRISFHSSSPVFVSSDPTMMERILVNLLSNALTHAAPSPITVDVGRGEGWVSLRVIDHGPGVPESERAQFFQPFRRVGDGNPTSGVGVGLAIARGFAEALGGELLLDDTPGGGCTLVLTLPPEGPDHS